MEVVQSEIANGPITSVALSSVLKFMQYGYLDISHGVKSLEALEMVVVAAMKCQFEALDSETDAVVIFKILKVLQRATQIDTALLLSDQIIYDMVQTCFKLSIQGRVSTLLRKSAEMTLSEIFQFAFTASDSPMKEKLSLLYIPADVLSVSPREETDTPATAVPDAAVRVNAQGVSFVKDTTPAATSAPPTTPAKAHGSKSRHAPSFVPTSPPFSVYVLVKLIRFLCTMINPKDPSTTEPMRYLGLTLVSSILEIRGASLAENRRLLDVISNDVSRYLIQSVRIETNLPLLSLTMRICNNLFSTLRSHLGFQLELFLKSCFAYFPEYDVDPNLASRAQAAATPSKPGQSPDPAAARSFAHQELILDVLLQLCRDPTFALDLLITYDCQARNANLFELLVGFFERACDSRFDRFDVAPENIKTIRSQANNALSAILLGVSARYTRAHQPVSNDSALAPTATDLLSKAPTVKDLKDQLAMKVAMKIGADQFNAKPREGLKYLSEHGVLPNPPTAKSVALFLRTNPFVNKTVIGEYFGERKDFNHDVIKEYSLLFDWDSKSYVEAVRDLLESFRISGDSPVIEKILDIWTKTYYERYEVEEEVEVTVPVTNEAGETETITKKEMQKVNKHPIFRSLDACYMIAMSIIMLNVDLYNPNLKRKRMTFESYAKNLKGQNLKEDFPLDYLRPIYTAIKEAEIRIVEEHMQSGTADIPQTIWQTIWHKQNVHQNSPAAAAHAAQLSLTMAAGQQYGIYDEILFAAVWKTLVSSAKIAWTEALPNTDALQPVSMTFYALGNLAAHFKQHAAFDALITSLTEVTTILTPHKDYSFELRFTQDKKAQAATSILFALAHEHANLIREGWKSINDLLIVLHAQFVLPAILDEVTEDATFQFKDLPPPVSTNPALTSKPTNTNSPITNMFSSLWKWGSGAAAAALGPMEIPNEEVPAELERFRSMSRQMLVDCHLPDVIAACSKVDADSLLFFMQVLILGSSPAPLGRSSHMQPSSSAPSVQNSNASRPSEAPTASAPSTPAIDASDSQSNASSTSTEEAPIALQHPQPTKATTSQETTVASSGPPTPTPKVVIGQSSALASVQNHRRLAPRAASKNRFEDSVALFCVDMLAHLALLNAHRVSLVWPIVSNHFIEIVQLSNKPTPLTERAIVNLLVVVAKLLPSAIGVSSRGSTVGPATLDISTKLEIPSVNITVASHMCKVLEQISPATLGSDLSKAYSHKIAHAMRVILRRNAKAIGSQASEAEWAALLNAICTNMSDTSEHMEFLVDVLSSSLVKGVIPESMATSAQGFATNRADGPPAKLDLVALSSTLVSPQNIRAVHVSVLKILTHPAASLDALVEGMDCAQALLILGPQQQSANPSLSIDMLNPFVMPIFNVLAQLAHDNRIVVRQTSLSQLQKAFCSPGLSFASSGDWVVLFEQIIFPLLDRLVSPAENPSRGPSNTTREATEEAFMRAVAVLSKTYLHCMAIVLPSSLALLWSQVLQRYAAFYNSASSSEVVQESVVQSVKNTLSVMNSSGILLPSPPEIKPEHSEVEVNILNARYLIWTESWPVIDRFAPSLRSEFAARPGFVVPPPVVQPVAVAPTPVAEPSSPAPSSGTSSSAPSAAPGPQSPAGPQSPVRAQSPASTPASPSELVRSSGSAGSAASPMRTSSPINPPGTVLEL